MKKNSVLQNVSQESKNSVAGSSQHLLKIKTKAYEFWEMRGRKNGNDQSNWFEAEKVVKEKESKPKSDAGKENRGGL